MNYREIEAKWQKYWDDHETFKAVNGSEKPPYYILVEFPYPSGAGLHVGHVRSYSALDAMARIKRMQGYNVLYPMGWDAFGAPAEEYAIKNHIHPSEAVKENIKTFKGQMETLGFSFDWNREFSTTDPEYYKWTQWQFLKFYEHGMAYKDTIPVNWCPNCKMVLSNEDAAGGVCERCGTSVVQKEKSQWMLRMSDYAEDLLDGLKDTHFAERVKLGQINWIGKSVGAHVVFKVDGYDETFTVFTTRCDTLFGATYCVLAPENKLVDIITTDEQKEAVSKYRVECSKKNEMERTELNKDKTGVFTGAYAINPVNGKKIPIWISDYVLATYGTGAIMAVPAHDERDYEFAKKFDLEIIPVIEGGDIEKEAYVGDGIHINSDFLDGLNKEDSINKMIEWLEEKGIGTKHVNYKMRDWIFSRQRFWGEPIPMIDCPKCGWVPVPEEELPLLLPNVTEYEPTDNGESPLAKIDEFVNCKCPKCGGDAKRETDTMPQWAGSSWYFLRYMDSKNNKEFASMGAMKYWGQVDWYNGGMEHTARHLLYARFWVQFLYNIGLVPKKEMIDVRVSHGMILGADNQKMSKSKGNVINPDDVVNEYGADTLRVYEMFIGDYTGDAPWSTESLNGCFRFINRIIRIGEKLNETTGFTNDVSVNKTIKKVTDDVLNMKYNTAIAALMTLLNEYERFESGITKDDYRIILTLLNPFAPHITEELNEKYKLGEPICESDWPDVDESKLIEDTVTIGVQVNGKLRDTITISVDTEEEDIKTEALNSENVLRHTEGKEIVKVIVIKGKIVNIVVK